MDNAILIVAGDAIDTSLGVTLGISTMCAAAIGNIISDVAGIMLGTIIEDFTARLGLPVPNVSAAQRQLRSVRFAGQFGTTVGIVIGCIIGMFPLLLIDSNKVQRMKEVCRWIVRLLCFTVSHTNASVTGSSHGWHLSRHCGRSKRFDWSRVDSPLLGGGLTLIDNTILT
jgi:tRNA-specific adenosine deaminase 1